MEEFLLANPWIRKLFLVVLVFAAGALSSAWMVHDHYIKKIAATEAMQQALIENANTQFKAEDVIVVTQLQTKWRDRIIWKDRLIAQLGEVKNEDDNKCSLGPAFVRLHNDAARALPTTGSGIDAATTSRTPNGGP